MPLLVIVPRAKPKAKPKAKPIQVAVRAAPTRQGLMSKMGPSEEEVITAMREVIPMFSAVLQLNKKFLTEKSVESK